MGSVFHAMIDRRASSSMTLFTRSFILLVCTVLACGNAAQAQAVEWEFTTATGETLVLSPIDAMECADMDKMLARIDSTRYRENAPTPHHEADEPLFEYELLLAEENYNRCVLVRKRTTGGLMIMRRLQSQ